MSVTVMDLQVSDLRITPLRVALAPGVSDHGALAGLEDDDHPQYLTETRGDARYAATAHTHSVVDLTPSAPLTLSGASTLLVDHDPAAIDPDAAHFYLNCTDFPGINLPQSARANVVWTLGYNVGDGGDRVDASEPTLALHFESFYCPNPTGPGPEWLEFHVQSVDTNGVVHRPIGMALPRDGAKANSDIAFNANSISLNEYDFTQRVKFDFNSNAAYLTNLTVFGETNNIPVFRQKNAAGTGYLKLPYIKSNDKLEIETQIEATPASPGASGFGAQWSFQGAPGHGSSLFAVSAGAATNAVVNAFNCTVSTNWELLTYVRNSSTAASNTAAMVIANDSASGWAYARFEKSDGSIQWSVGKNRSGNFEIAGMRPETGTALTIDKTTRQTAFVYPPKLPSYTVAGLPAAATAGAGALAYVTNATGGPTLACSDGASWRVVAALGAVVS